jgi:NAD(P)-dependent dehydrogenase (short-subunit alcohol dehydrogenase family)
LTAHGARVSFSYLGKQGAAQALCDELEAHGAQVLAVQGDLADEAFAERFLAATIDRWGMLDCLVNNVGITGRYGTFAELPEQALRRTFEINVFGTMRLTQDVIRRWRATGVPGRIVNLSSVAATLGSPGEYVHYAASKAAIDAFTIGLGKELAGDGIRVNAVAPGTAMTDIHAAGGAPDRPARMAGKIPLQRVAQPEEIANAVVWLLSDEASYTTGAVVRVAGGL